MKIEKAGADEPAESEPQFDPLPRMNGKGAAPKVVRYGIEWTKQGKGHAS